MAIYAKIDSNSVVVDLIVADAHFIESTEGTFIETLPSNYANIGGTYDSTNAVFIPVQPFPSWLINNETHQWEAPSPKPITNEDVGYTYWDEELSKWIIDKGGNVSMVESYLRASDYRMLNDYEGNDAPVWVEYRAALRALDANHTPTFPAKI